MEDITADIFERLRNGETISSNDPQAYKMREASFATKQLLVQMNNASNPEVIRDLLGQITHSAIDETTTIFTPFQINYGKHTKIGKNVFINFDCVFLDLGGITIEDNVFIGPNATFTNETVPRSKTYDHTKLKKTLIKKGASIGGKATILPGVEIGEYAFIGAGSVVNRNIPRNTLWYGNPARQKGFITNDGILLDMHKKDKDGNFHELNSM